MDDKRAPALCWTFFCESIYEKESKQTNKKKNGWRERSGGQWCSTGLRSRSAHGWPLKKPGAQSEGNLSPLMNKGRGGRGACSALWCLKGQWSALWSVFKLPVFLYWFSLRSPANGFIWKLVEVKVCKRQVVCVCVYIHKWSCLRLKCVSGLCLTVAFVVLFVFLIYGFCLLLFLENK